MRHNLGASYDQHTSYLAVAGTVRIRGLQSIMHEGLKGGMVSRHGPVPGNRECGKSAIQMLRRDRDKDRSSP